MYTSPAHSGYLIRDTIFQDNGNGIHLGASGTHPTLVCRNRFVANNEFEGPTGAYGIYSDKGAQQVLITANRFERHNGAAIFLADKGKLQRDIVIEHNKSVDDKTFASIFNSTRVRVTSNWIRARVNEPPFTDDPASAIFIGARNDDIVVQKNRVKSASGNGIDISNTGGNRTPGPAPTNVVVRKNKVANTQLAGIDVSATGGPYQVLANQSRDNTKFGIHFAPGTNGGAVTGNTARGNEVDCRDQTTGPLNTWTGNVGGSSQPAALCTTPTLDDDPGHDREKKKFKKHKKHHKKTKKQNKHRPDPCACSLPWRY
jgi:nitrous oxidase accessory protein NosD